MSIFKKLLFGILFLLSFATTIYITNPLIMRASAAVILELSSLLYLITLSLILLVTGLLFVLFNLLSGNLRISIGGSVIASLLPLLLINNLQLAVVTSIGSLVSFLIVTITINSKLKNYTSFEPGTLFSPSIRLFAALLALVISVGFCISLNTNIPKYGLSIPDSLLDAAVDLVSGSASQVKGESIAQVPGISEEQLNFLRNNPDLVKQYGYDPSILNNVSPSPQQTTKSNVNSLPISILPIIPDPKVAARNIIKSTLTTALKPYLTWVAIALSVLLFLELQSIISILSFLLPLIIWAIFKILEKTGYITYTKEMREVKKLVI